WVGPAGPAVRPAAGAFPVVLVACPRPATCGAAVRRDDGGLGAAPLHRPRRRVEGPHDTRLTGRATPPKGGRPGKASAKPAQASGMALRGSGMVGTPGPLVQGRRARRGPVADGARGVRG